MKKILLFFFLTSIMIGCSSENPFKDRNNSVERGTKIFPEEAARCAISYMKLIFPETRGENRSDYRITPVRRIQTRSPQNGLEYPDTLYYVINFGKDKGFALMGADRRLPELLAISDSDNMDLRDTLTNKGLANFMSNLSLPYLPVEPPRDSITNTLFIVGPPMLTSSVRKWKQGAPYNAECPIFPEGQAPTGCVPLAVGQVMTFYEHPDSYGLINLDWNKIKKGEADATVAELLRCLGTKSNLNSEYTPTGTGTEVINLKRTFNNFRYDFTPGLQPLNKSFPYDLLNQRFDENAHPLLIYGKGYEINNSDPEQSFVHVWVADGCLTKISTDEDGDTSTDFYIHCVWGGGGTNNGYFLYTFNGVIGGKPDEFAPGDMKYNYEGCVYNKNLSGWYDYKPKK